MSANRSSNNTAPYPSSPRSAGPIMQVGMQRFGQNVPVIRPGSSSNNNNNFGRNYPLGSKPSAVPAVGGIHVRPPGQCCPPGAVRPPGMMIRPPIQGMVGVPTRPPGPYPPNAPNISARMSLPPQHGGMRPSGMFTPMAISSPNPLTWNMMVSPRQPPPPLSSMTQIRQPMNVRPAMSYGGTQTGASNFYPQAAYSSQNKVQGSKPNLVPIGTNKTASGTNPAALAISSSDKYDPFEVLEEENSSSAYKRFRSKSPTKSSVDTHQAMPEKKPRYEDSSTAMSRSRSSSRSPDNEHRERYNKYQSNRSSSSTQYNFSGEKTTAAWTDKEPSSSSTWSNSQQNNSTNGLVYFIFSIR